MARENIGMSAAEIRSFLGSVEWVALGYLDDGAPAGAVAAALVSGDQLLFALEPGSEAAAALDLDPRCCCTADVFPSYREIRGATVHGAARKIVPEPAAAAAMEARASKHDLPAGVVYGLPLRDDSFGFDFSKLAPR